MHSHQFNCFFSCQMLYIETNHHHSRQTFLKLLLQCFILVRIISIPKHSGHFQLLSLILDDVDSAKGNDTPEVGRVRLWMHFVLLDDTERRLLTLADGIYLMPAHRTVEIDAALRIDIADGDGVGIVTITQQGQSARRAFLQDANAFIQRKLLAFTPHFPELFHNLKCS